MNNQKYIGILIIFLSSLFLGSCKKNQENFDIDLSNFKPKVVEPKVENKEKNKDKQKDIINKLNPLINREKVISSIKYGKNDPFANNSDNNSNNFISSFKLYGFISLNNNNHALVQYLDNKGLINTKSIGGLNTKLIPKGAKVKKIIPEKEIIYIQLNEETFEIKLNSK